MSGEDRRLILVRHAPVVMEPAAPSAQWQLSAAGRDSCLELASNIGKYRPANIVTSYEPKAQQTGKILADSLGLPWQTAENLHEQERKRTPFLESQEEFRAAVARLLTGPEDELVFGEETAGEARLRFDKGIQSVLADFPTGNIVVVTHGTIMTLFLCRHNPALVPVTFWRGLALPDYVVVSLPDFRLQT